MSKRRKFADLVRKAKVADYYKKGSGEQEEKKPEGSAADLPDVPSVASVDDFEIGTGEFDSLPETDKNPTKRFAFDVEQFGPLEDDDLLEIEELEAEAPPLAEFTLLRPISLLLLDDDPLFRRMFYDVFNSDNVHVTVCGNQHEAQRSLEQGTFDLILSDLHMPGFNGVEFVMWIRGRYGVNQGDCYVITADSRPEMKAEAAKLGIDGWIFKDKYIDEVTIALTLIAEDLEEQN